MGTIMLNTVSRTALAAAALLALGTQSASAQDATAFADRLVETSRLMGLAFSYGSATAEGDTITVSDFTFTVPGEDPTEVPGDVIFEGVVETEDGGFTAERATIADIEYTDEEEGISLSLANIAAEGIVLPAQVDQNNMLEIGFELYDRFSAGPLTVSDADGAELFAVANMEVWVEDPDAEGGYRTGYTVDGITADLSSIDDPEAQPVIEAFGLQQINASMNGVGTWWPETGVLTIDDMAFVVDDLATLRMAMSLEGYTTELYDELVKINLKMVELAEAGEELSDEHMAQFDDAMMAYMADIAIVDGSLRYEDASLFDKVLDFVGAEQGVDGETFKAGLQFMVPMALAEVENEEFKTMVTQAVNTFIADPQNFTISVDPDQPVLFSAFEDRADEIEADPFILVEMLNVLISANDQAEAAQ
jgi:hypothetical protein